LTEILRLLAKLVSSSLERRLEAWSARLTPDLPRLSGGWVVGFSYPKPLRGRGRDRINLTFKQFGARIDGVGHVEGMPDDPLVYEGRINRNVLYGTVRRKNRGVLAGLGTFVLKIGSDSRTLVGTCAWYQSRKDGVWASRIRLSRHRGGLHQI